MDYKNERFASQIHRLVAEFFEHESNRDALITVTRVSLDEGMHNATVFLSVLPKEKVKDVLPFAIRKRSDLRTFIMKTIRNHSIPRFDIVVE